MTNHQEVIDSRIEEIENEIEERRNEVEKYEEVRELIDILYSVGSVEVTDNNTTMRLRAEASTINKAMEDLLQRDEFDGNLDYDDQDDVFFIEGTINL